MEFCVFIMQVLSRFLADTFLTGAKSTKVFYSLGKNGAKKAKNYTGRLFASDFNVKEYFLGMRQIFDFVNYRLKISFKLAQNDFCHQHKCDQQKTFYHNCYKLLIEIK